MDFFASWWFDIFLGQAEENNFERKDPNRIHSSNWSMQVIASSLDLSWTFHFCLTPPWLTIQHPLLWKPGEKGTRNAVRCHGSFKRRALQICMGRYKAHGPWHRMANRWKSWFSLSSEQMVGWKNDLTVNPKNSSFLDVFVRRRSWSAIPHKQSYLVIGDTVLA